MIRKFICGITILLSSGAVQGFTAKDTLSTVRPPVADRTFQSPAIDGLINTLVPLFANTNLATLLTNCLPNTLDTTVYYHSSLNESLDSFIITGDIEAMWLRDSTNQVLPYIPYAPFDEDLKVMLEGLIARQARSVLIDSFANAFNFNASGEGHQSDQRTPPMGPAVFEGKYEIDSLCAFLKLSYWHFRYSGDEALERFATPQWLAAVSQLLDTGTRSSSHSLPLFLFNYFIYSCTVSECDAEGQRAVPESALPVRPRDLGGAGHPVRANSRPSSAPQAPETHRGRRSVGPYSQPVPTFG